MAAGKSTHIESIGDPASPTNLGATVPVSGTVTASYADVAQTYSAPANKSVLDSTTEIVAANASRKHITIVNDSDTTIYLAAGAAAVLNKGIRINANGGVAQFGGAGGLPLTTQAINGISSVTGKNVTVQEST